MKRTAYDDLVDWKGDEFHKPLLVFGARRVGKTHLIRDFAKAEYEKVIYLSFEQTPDLKSLFENDPEAAKVLRDISSLSKIDVTPGNTLIILDDIQFCPDALGVLPDFAESQTGFDIMVCGFTAASPKAESKIDELTRTGVISKLQVYPMSFKEFLMATGKDNMAAYLVGRNWSAVGSLLPKYDAALRDYLFCGGLPQVVQEFVSGRQPGEIRSVQKDILAAIEADFLRFAPKRHADEITSLWLDVPKQLLEDKQKFTLARLREHARLKDFESSIDWLVRAGLIYKVHKLGRVSMPIDFFQDKRSFKLFPFDPGLAAALLDIDPARLLVGDEAFEGFNRSLLQILVIGQLAQRAVPVCYYGLQGSTVEIDFVVQEPSMIVSIEVMPHQNGNSKALKLFCERNPGRKCIRASLDNHFDRLWMENVPAYTVGDYLDVVR